MKNYYKILGVKETASEDEIRARWVELTKQYHPDLSESRYDDEKIKEINEAYQILKFSSTRTEYDLERSYDRKKRGSYLQRLTFPACVLIFLLILGTLYFKRPQIPFNPINQIDTSPQRTQLTQRLNDTITQEPNGAHKQTNLIDSMTLQTKEIATQKTQSATALPPIEAIELMGQKIQDAISRPSSVYPVSNSSGALNPALRGGTPYGAEPGIILKSNPAAEQRGIISNGVDENKIDATNLRLEDTTTSQSNDPIDPMDQREQVFQPVVSSQILPKPLIATEKEVNQFFVNYIDRYTQKDIEGFLSLFFSKAIQNQKDGLGGIRKIYNDFVNQSQELQYRIEDMKIEIYENAVEVKARYEVNQILKGGGEKLWKGHIRWVLVKEDGALKILSLDYQHRKTP
jgi:hypothetical protein